MEKSLPSIPAKRYFTIGEVSELCGVKPYVLRYWEQEFTQLKPMKRRGNRRYYQHHEVLLIRRIRELLYEQGFTISGARNRLVDGHHARQEPAHDDFTDSDLHEDRERTRGRRRNWNRVSRRHRVTPLRRRAPSTRCRPRRCAQELISIRVLLSV